MGKKNIAPGLSEKDLALLALANDLTPEEINKQYQAIHEANKRSRRNRKVNEKRKWRY